MNNCKREKENIIHNRDIPKSPLTSTNFESKANLLLSSFVSFSFV